MREIHVIDARTGIAAEKLRVAAYCRVSSDSDDQLNSFLAQVRHYTAYIGQNPEWELADVYADEGLTGTRMDKRDEFNRLMADCRKGKVDLILVKSVSRFARNTMECLKTVRMLRELGVVIHFENEAIRTDRLTSEMMLAIPGTLAQEDSISISQNLRWSYQKRMSAGVFNSCCAAFGYTLINGKLEINEEEAAIVRQIFQWFLLGIGKQRIARMLNEGGAGKRYGYPVWYSMTVDYILNNERYMGDCLLQKSYMSDTLPFRKVRNRGEKTQYYVENSNPPIVNREIFLAVRTLLESRKREYHPKGNWPLTKKVICPVCGHHYRRIVSNDVVYWLCSYGASGKSDCSDRRVSEGLLYETISRLAGKLRCHAKEILTPMLEQLEEWQKKSSGHMPKIHEIDLQTAELQKQKLVLARLKSKGYLDAAEYTRQNGEIQIQIDKLRRQRTKLLCSEDDQWLLELKATCCLIASDQPLDVETVLECVVNTMTIEDDGMLTVRLLGGLTLRESLSPTEMRYRAS